MDLDLHSTQDAIMANKGLHSGKLTELAGKWTRNEDVFPIENEGYSSQLC